MTLTKAIEILEDLLTEAPQYPPSDRRNAVQIGIEASSRIHTLRRDPCLSAAFPLPSEDED